MSSTFDTIANIIAETCDIPRDSIKPESHAIKDLGIDSLDFLDIAFAIDKAFGIKLPLEQWTQEVNDGKAPTDQYFVLKNSTEASVPTTSTIFEGHFPGFPLMPCVLLIEAMAQTSGWLLVAVNRFERMAFLAAVKDAKFRMFVTPGRKLSVG